MGSYLKRWEPAISRVLSRVIIHLGSTSPWCSSNLPGNSADHAIVPLFGLAPGGVYHATECYHRRGALLPHPFTLTGKRIACLGGLLSAALSVGLRPPGVTWHLVLRSPDFPRCVSTAITWPTPTASVQVGTAQMSARHLISALQFKHPSVGVLFVNIQQIRRTTCDRFGRQLIHQSFY